MPQFVKSTLFPSLPICCPIFTPIRLTVRMSSFIARIDGVEYSLAPPEDSEIIKTGSNSYHLLLDGVGHHCRLLDYDLAKKKLLLEVDGQRRLVTLRDEVDQLVDRLGLSVVPKSIGKDIIAPMPGLVLDVLIEAGSTVEADTPLIVLEAMKMENVLKATGAGTIVNITVGKGDAVEKNQLLIEID